MTSHDASSPDRPAANRTGRYRWSPTDGVCLGIVEALAAATGRDATELPALQQQVDSDALESLLTTGTADDVDVVTVSFPYDGATVTVSSDGWITVG